MDLTPSASKDPIEGGRRLWVWLGLLNFSMGVICRVMPFCCESATSVGEGGADGSLRIAGMAETMAFNYNSRSFRQFR
jgi:hypothetical protein